MKHQYTVYYNIAQTDLAGDELFKHGLEACQKIDCDYMGFDQLFGRVICRWQETEEEPEFAHEFAFPSNFYMGTMMHWGGEENHKIHVEAADKITKAMANGGPKLTPGPESG